MLSYMISAPLLGWLGGRINRPRLSAVGLMLWSFTTALAGLATDYRMLAWFRSLVGIGEASFSTISPTLLADYFAKKLRGRVFALFYLAIPMGSALGYIFGGILGEHFGWRAAFLMVGLPGLILSIPLWMLREPLGDVPETQSKHQYAEMQDYFSLFKNRSFILNNMAMTAMTFAMGGIAQWMPTFFYRVHRVSLVTANSLFGGIIVVAGITGTLAGGWIGDKLQQKRGTKGYLHISGLGLLLSAPIALYALISSSFPLSMGAMLVAAFLLFLNTGPLNTVIVSITKQNVRTMAFAVNIFFIHALGDAFSPTLLGWFSDLWGLRIALMTTVLAILVAAFFCFLCTRFIHSDEVLIKEDH